MNACLLILALGGCAVPVARAAIPVPEPAADRWVAEDKAQHFAMSFAITSMTYGAARSALPPDPARGTAAGLAILLGVGKELTDAAAGDRFSLKDLAWDAAGVALGLVFTQRIQ